MAVGNGLDLVHVVLEGQVRNDDAIDAYFLATLEESLVAHVIDGIHVAHQYQGKPYALFPERFQLRKELRERHAVAQSLGCRVLNNWAVCHRVTEGNAHFDEVYAIGLHGLDDVGCAVERRMSCTKVERQQALLLLLKYLINSIHVL